MGIIAKAQAAQEPAKGNDFKSILERSWPRIQSVMPRHMSSDRLFQLAMSAYNTTPKLAECSPSSVLSCVMKCSALGMEPSAVDGLGRAYILPYRNGRTGRMEATFILGYKGMLDLARRSGELKDVSARAVYEGDEFSYSFGLEDRLHHVPSLEPKEGRRLTHVYAVAHFKDGGYYFDVMGREEVEAIRKRSKSGEKGPWVTDYEAMARKTVLRRIFPYLPVSVEAAQASATDESTPVFVDSDGVVLDPMETDAEACEASIQTGGPEYEEQPAYELE